MASDTEFRGVGFGAVATTLSAAAYWFGTGLHPHAWLTWLAPLPLLLLAPRLRRRWIALAAFVAGAAGAMNQWHYLHDAIVLPLAVILQVVVAPGLILALCVLLFRRLLLMGRPVAAALSMPALWVAVEYVNARISPHGTFGNIGYTQMDMLPVIQVAAITGIWGIGFLLLLLPASLAVLPARHVPMRARLCAMGIALAMLGMSLAFGVWRLPASPTATVRVGLVSLEKPIRPALADPAGQALLQRYVAAIDRLAARGARIVVIPETILATADPTIPAFADAASRAGATVAVGIDFKGDARAERNMLMAFQPQRASPATYSKHHLIPGYEGQYTPGTDYAMLDGAPRIGLAICKDMDFQDIGRAYARRNAQLLLVPAWDFGVDGWLHGRMAIMRGVESGFAIARTARTGRLTLSDDRGRVVAEASSEHADAELVGDLPLHDTRTFYARRGDWFAWCDLALLLGVLVRCFRGPRKQS